MLRQSRASDTDTLAKVKEEKNQLQNECFLLNENYKLQEIELKQLKDERDVLRNTIEQINSVPRP